MLKVLDSRPLPALSEPMQVDSSPRSPEGQVLPLTLLCAQQLFRLFPVPLRPRPETATGTAGRCCPIAYQR